MTRKMKDSGVEWIGYIPEGWEVSKLKHIGFFSASGIDKKIKKNENRVKIVNYVDIYHSKNKLIKNYNYMEVTASSEKIKEHNLIKGDALFTPSSETIEEIGYSAIIDEGLMDTSYSYHLLRFRFNKEIVHNYKRFMFSNESLLNQFASRARGTTRKTLNRIDFEEAVVPLPSKIEQKSIADFLDEKTQEIDNIISKTKKVIEEYKRYKQSLITETVTKGLDYNVEMKDSGIEWIGEIPEDWEIIKVKQLFKIGRGRVIAKTELDEKYPYPVYSSQTKNDGILGYLQTYDFEGPRLTWTTDGANAGTVFIRDGKYNCTNVCGTLELKDEINDLQYLKYTLEYIAIFHKRADTNGYKIMNNEMANIEIVLPSEHKQKAIADFLDEKTQEIDNIISKTKKVIEEYKRYKQSLITETVTGKREVE